MERALDAQSQAIEKNRQALKAMSQSKYSRLTLKSILTGSVHKQNSRPALEQALNA